MKSLPLSLALIGSATLAPVALAEDRTVTFVVENMTCSTCPYIVKTSMTKVPGVSQVTVSFVAKTATVRFDDARTNAEAVAEASTKAGFPARATEQGS